MPGTQGVLSAPQDPTGASPWQFALSWLEMPISPALHPVQPQSPLHSPTALITHQTAAAPLLQCRILPPTTLSPSGGEGLVLLQCTGKRRFRAPQDTVTPVLEAQQTPETFFIRAVQYICRLKISFHKSRMSLSGFSRYFGSWVMYRVQSGGE